MPLFLPFQAEVSPVAILGEQLDHVAQIQLALAGDDVRALAIRLVAHILHIKI